MSSLSIGVSALATAQAGLLTTEHNISNVNTPGFHRQQTVQSTNIPLATGIGFIGQGAHVDTVKRIYAQLLDSQVMQAQTQSSHLDSYYAQITQLDNMLADPSAGVTPALQDFFNGVQAVATDPASIPSRQSMLSGAQTMAARFQSINQRITEISDGLNNEIRSSVGVINSYAKQIASLNQQIGIVEGSSSGQPANDLQDQRDQLIGELNKIIKVSTFKQDDGSLNVFIGNGQSLVIGTQSFSLGSAPSQEDPERLDVGVSFGGSTIALPKGSLQGGTLGGLLAFRDETLGAVQSALGLMAIGLTQTFNDQHVLGTDLRGNMGSNFFNVSAPKVIPNTTNPALSNATATFNNVGLLTGNDYKLSYDGSSWSLLNQTTNQTVAMTGTGTAADPFVAEGMNFVVTAPAAGGASFLIRPTINGARDISVKLTDTASIAVAAPMRTSATLNNVGTGQISPGTVNSFNDKVTFTFTSASTFDVVDTTSGATLAKNVSYTSGGNISYNGWTVKITNGSGAPATGDVFTLDHAVASTTSTTAKIGLPVIATPPVDPFLSNTVRVVFDSASLYHLEGQTNNITGASTIVGGAVAPTQGKSVGSAAVGSLIIGPGNDTLNITVDGVSATVTIPAGAPYGSAALLATAVQTAINTNAAITAGGKAVTVTQLGGVFTITSNSYGATSAANVTGGNGRANLLGVPTVTAGTALTTTLTGVATVGTGGSTVAGGAGAYTATGIKTTISGGTVTGTGPFTVTGATVTLEGGSFAGSTTFSGVTLTISAAGDISIPAVGPGGIASTFNGRPATGNIYDSTGNNLISANGWTVDITGIPNAGDSFTVSRNAGGVSDNRNALLLAGLQTQNTLSGGTATYQGVYSQLVSSVGNKTREVKVTASAQESLVLQTQQAQQSMSGVNLDEEAANLMRFQQAYQAAGKMMQISSGLFDVLLGLGK